MYIFTPMYIFGILNLYFMERIYWFLNQIDICLMILKYILIQKGGRKNVLSKMWKTSR